MIQYTKEYIARLLDRYMDGTSTLQEEDILAQYFKGDNIPEEWACYKEMFQEIEAMKPETEADQPVAAEEPTHRRRRWMIWGVAAAAAVAGIIYLAAPGNKADFQPAAPLTAQADTTAVQQTAEPVIQTQPETVGTDSLTAPKTAVKPAKATKRSKRKIVHHTRCGQGLHTDGTGQSRGRSRGYRGSVGSLRLRARNARRWYHSIY